MSRSARGRLGYVRRSMEAVTIVYSHSAFGARPRRARGCESRTKCIGSDLRDGSTTPTSTV